MIIWILNYFLIFSIIILKARGQLSGRTIISDPDVGMVYLQAGSELQLKCVQKDRLPVEWFRGGTQIFDGSQIGFYILSDEEKGELVSTLMKTSRTNKNDTGMYSCQPKGRVSDAYHIGLVVYEIISNDYVIKKPFEDAHLTCRVEGLPEGIIVQSVHWTRHGETIVADEKLNQINVHESKLNTTLDILSVQPQMIGNYTCEFLLSSSTELKSAVASIHASPQVKFNERSVNVVEEDTVTLICNIWGLPVPAVSWFMQYETSSEISPLPEDKRFVVENITLTILNATFSDRANYLCVANNIHGNNTASILVRVKGKYAALWPFLGIIVELVILFIIIASYECYKRKKKKVPTATLR